MIRQPGPLCAFCRLALLLIILPFSSFLGLTPEARAQTSLEEVARPQAVPEASAEAVPLELALKIVTDEATARWPRFAVGSPILCSDDNGKLVAYMIPVRLDGDVFPSDRALVLSHGPNRQSSAFDWGAGDYYTFVVSARERDFPIPCEFNTLPPFFVTATKGREVAQQELQTDEVSLTKFYFLGHRGEYFEFEGAGKTVLIDAYRLKIADSSRALYRKGQTTKSLPQIESLSTEARLAQETYGQQVREEWKRLKERAAQSNPTRR